MSPNTRPQLRILVVDDEDMVRDTLKMLLQFDRHLVEVASSASQALAVFQPGRFDLVITDYEMGDMKGDQLAAAIKALVPTQPVVMVTAYAEAVQHEPSVMKNLDGLVSKPFRVEALREAIAHAAVGKRLPPSSPSP
jgi:CheY-like chemotaxis protein